MKTKIKQYISVGLLMISFSFTGCVELDVEPTNKFTDESFWTSMDRANALLSMGYDQMMDSKRIFRDERLSDNLYNGYGGPTEKIIQTGVATPSTGIFHDEWKDSYAGIKTTHTFLANIDRLKEVDGINEDVVERMKAEARFIRAFIYFRLTNWYGDIPFFLEDIDLETSKTISRTPQATIVEWLHEELEKVAELLPRKDQYDDSDRGRITSGAAMALNARVALNFNDWNRVIKYTKPIIDGTYGNYSLFSNYQELFYHKNQYNNEIILDVQYVTTYRTWDQLLHYLPFSVESNDYVNATPTQDLVDAYRMLDGSKWTDRSGSIPDMYENRDPRLAMTIVYNGSTWTSKGGGEVRSIITNPNELDDKEKAAQKDWIGKDNGGRTGYFYRKYYDINTDAWTSGTSWNCNINIPTIRYADILLMYAEAMFEKGDMNNTVWEITIGALRDRAGFTDSAALDYPSGMSNSDMQELIRDERRVELALEGLRIFDIRRWKTAHIELSKPMRGAKFSNGGTEYYTYPAGTFNSGRDYLWAVPLSQIDINPNLGQNPGY